MRRSVCVVVLQAFLGLAATGEAGADPSTDARWLVLPATTGAPIESLHRDAEALRQELALRGYEVWRADRASERFEVVGSAPAPNVSQSDIDRWVERSRAAVKYLARADYKAARRELRAAQRLADQAADELNREAARAQQVLDTCLFMVRAYVETKNEAEARRQARECRRLVPRVEPSAFRHTPEVRDLLAEVDREMAAEAPGILRVTSTPTGCLVRINGVEFGNTPLLGVELPIGTYRLQVECEPERRGRIHREEIRSGVNPVHIDVGLDRAIKTRPALHLRYVSDATWSAERMAHAEQVASALGGAARLVVSEPTHEVVRIDLDGVGLSAASVWLMKERGELSSEEARRGLEALLEGRAVDFTGPHPIAQPSWLAERRATQQAAVAEAAAAAAVTNASAEVHHGPSRERRIAGWSLFGLGVAAMGASVGLHLRRGNLGDEFVGSPSSLPTAVPAWMWSTPARRIHLAMTRKLTPWVFWRV